MDTQHQRLIERGFPCHQAGAETQWERGASSALPPLYFLHVWWARRPVTPCRAAIVASLADADTDPATFVHQLGIAASMEMPPQELYQIYVRLTEGAQQTRAPVDLAAIWQTLCESRYLRALGCCLHEEGNEPFMMLSNVPGVVDGMAITTSRTLFDAGSPAFEGRLHFVTYGDTVFEAILQQVEAFPLADGIRRLEVEVPGIQAPMVGYAVAERGGDGLPRCRLVTLWGDVATLHLDPSGSPSEPREPELELLRQRLRHIARQELAMAQAVPRIETMNERAGRAQLQLDYVVGYGLLQSRQQMGVAEPLFRREIQVPEEICQGRDSVCASDARCVRTASLRAVVRSRPAPGG